MLGRIRKNIYSNYRSRVRIETELLDRDYHVGRFDYRRRRLANLEVQTINRSLRDRGDDLFSARQSNHHDGHHRAVLNRGDDARQLVPCAYLHAAAYSRSPQAARDLERQKEMIGYIIGP
jgi:hypothetical protein